MSERTKKNIYIVCFILLCVVDHIKGTAIGSVQSVAENIAGLLFALIIFTSYEFKDFLKLVYYIWTGIFCVGLIIYTIISVNAYTDLNPIPVISLLSSTAE